VTAHSRGISRGPVVGPFRFPSWHPVSHADTLSHPTRVQLAALVTIASLHPTSTTPSLRVSLPSHRYHRHTPHQVRAFFELACALEPRFRVHDDVWLSMCSHARTDLTLTLTHASRPLSKVSCVLLCGPPLGLALG
jgi:hypothetical protein